MEPAYSIEITRALTGRPRVVFIAALIDVRQDHNGFTAVFSHPDDLDQGLVFELSASSDMVNNILKNRPSWGDKYVVVAEIQLVNKPLFAMRAYPESEEDASIQFEHDTVPAMAKGSLIAYTQIPLEKK